MIDHLFGNRSGKSARGVGMVDTELFCDVLQVAEPSTCVICSAEIGKFCPVLTHDCACSTEPGLRELLHQTLQATRDGC